MNLDLIACIKIDTDYAVNLVRVMVNSGTKVQTACKKVAEEYNKEYLTSSSEKKIYVKANYETIKKAYYRKIKS